MIDKETKEQKQSRDPEGENHSAKELLPAAFVKRMEQMLPHEAEDFFCGFLQEERHGLRLNPLKGSREEFFFKVGQDLKEIPWSHYGYYVDAAMEMGKHPYHEAGVYYLQEASAQAPATYLDPQPGERILDLCAAPGGKSTQIGAAMAGEGLLLCNEIHPTRAKILSENVERMGIANALVTNETPQNLEARFPEFFHRILVDAPCSGEGMFRKNEAACQEWSPENVAMCAKRQDEILDAAAHMLLPGGRMVYSTCTFSLEENEEGMQRFLARHPEFSMEPVPVFPGMEGALIPGLPGCIRLWPHKLEGEGHFLAVLKKASGTAEAEQSRVDSKSKKSEIVSEAEKLQIVFSAQQLQDAMAEKNMREALKEESPANTENETDGSEAAFSGKRGKKSSYKEQKGLREKELVAFRAFVKESLTKEAEEKLQGCFIKFGEQLYLVPSGTPNLDGIKVLRPGLHLGTCKKDRFEPSHALALYVKPGEVRNTVNLTFSTFQKEAEGDSRTVKAYLQGQTIPVSPEKKGWCLVTVDGYSLGWGKAGSGVLKNHYPKGLRKN